MLSVSSLRISKDEFESQREMEGFGIVGAGDDDDFAEFSDGNLLESINFDDLFVGDVGDVLPDLEMEPAEVLAEFSISGGEESSQMNSSSVSVENNNKNSSSNSNSDQNTVYKARTKEDEGEEYENKVCSGSGSGSGSGISESNSGSSSGGGDREKIVKPSAKEASKARKSSAQSKDSQGKRKVKVDWTPELHRRFVQAVEQLGVDKAVPSKILEIMGIACLTRHNIASHLQKYRSHRKHVVAREAEAARWRRGRGRSEMYGGGGEGKMRKVSPWVAVAVAPTLGYPQMVPPMHPPLHVWGHPTPSPTMVDHSFMPMWPQPHPLPLPLPHPPSAPPLHSSFWHHQQRFGCPPVPGIPPHAMLKVDLGVSLSTAQPSRLSLDFHPSKESIDTAIEDVLSKPWLPLPLGLKAPALDSVLSELQRQGIPKIPPSSA